MSTCRPFFVIVAATGCTTEPSCSLTTRSTSGATGGATSGTGDAAGATLASGGVDGAGPAEFALAFAGAAEAPGAALADGVTSVLGSAGATVVSSSSGSQRTDTSAPAGIDFRVPAENGRMSRLLVVATGRPLKDGWANRTPVDTRLGSDGCWSMVVDPVPIAPCRTSSAVRPPLDTRDRT